MAYDFVIQIFILICVSMTGSFLGLICYRYWERRKMMIRIRYHVVADLMHIKSLRNFDYKKMIMATRTMTPSEFKQTLKQIITKINLITDQKTMDIKEKYFELPLEESFKIQIVYNAVDQFNETIQKWRTGLEKAEITNEHLSKKNEIFEEIIIEWEKVNEPLMVLTQTKWYKKIENDLEVNPKYKY